MRTRKAADSGELAGDLEPRAAGARLADQKTGRHAGFYKNQHTALEKHLNVSES